MAAIVAAAPFRQAHAQGATVAFDAELAKVAAKPHAPFVAAGVSWNCSTTRCAGKGPGKDPLGACKAVVAQVGPLKSFMAAGRAVDLKSCGAVAPPMVAAPMKSAMPVGVAAAGAAAHAAPPPAPKTGAKPPAPPPPAPPPAPAPAPAPPAAPAAPAAAAAAPVGRVASFTTPTFTLTGTGAAPVVPATAGLAWTTPSFTLTGTGAPAPASTAAPIAFTTDTFRLSGSPP